MFNEDFFKESENVTILAHRGFWQKEEEKNSLTAFKQAFQNGFGIETDLRDSGSEIVISHDMPKGNEPKFSELLELLKGQNLPLALNIKADGMADEIKRLLKKFNHANYFTFDMSIPEMIYQHKKGLKIFSGLSDIIEKPIMLKEARGVWLDSFNYDWFGEKEIKEQLNSGKKVCIVSPELHEREHRKIWEKYKNIKGIMLCTDYPTEAREFFNE